MAKLELLTAMTSIVSPKGDFIIFGDRIQHATEASQKVKSEAKKLESGLNSTEI